MLWFNPILGLCCILPKEFEFLITIEWLFDNMWEVIGRFSPSIWLGVTCWPKLFLTEDCFELPGRAGCSTPCMPWCCLEAERVELMLLWLMAVVRVFKLPTWPWDWEGYSACPELLICLGAEPGLWVGVVLAFLVLPASFELEEDWGVNVIGCWLLGVDLMAVGFFCTLPSWDKLLSLVS